MLCVEVLPRSLHVFLCRPPLHEGEKQQRRIATLYRDTPRPPLHEGEKQPCFPKGMGSRNCLFDVSLCLHAENAKTVCWLHFGLLEIYLKCLIVPHIKPTQNSKKKLAWVCLFSQILCSSRNFKFF
jgi:hypothetical protein